MKKETKGSAQNELNYSLIFALMLGLFVSGLDASVVNIMLPKLQKVFSAPLSQTTLIATIYLTFMSAFQLISGRCADIFSSLFVFVCGLVLFFIGSLICALSGVIEQILIGRGIQGVGGAVLAASFGAIILTHVPREKIGSVLGSVMMVMSLGLIAGPPLGGLLAEHFSWHWAFIINLPLTAISALILLQFIKSSRSPKYTFKDLKMAIGNMDTKGAIFSVVALIALPTMFTVGAEKGWTSPSFIGTAAMFVMGGALFLRIELRVENPLIQLRIFRSLRLNLVLLIKSLTFMILNGVMLVFPFFITGSSSMNVSQAGLFLLISAVAMALTTPIAGRMTDRLEEIDLIICAAIALILVTIGAFYIGKTPSTIVMSCVLAGFGAALSILMVACSMLILKQAPSGQEGIFSALNSLIVPVAGSVGLAIFSAFYTYGENIAAPGLRAYSGFTISMQAVLICVILLLGVAVVYKKGIAQI